MSNLIDFFVTGGPRSGTTFLHNLLSRQPSISMSKEKETNYYLDSIVESSGTGRVSSLYDYDSLFEQNGGVRGETSPFYFYDTIGMQRLHSENPNVKCVIILRNPVDRSYSHYCMDRDRYGIKLPCYLDSLAGKQGVEVVRGVENNYRDMSLYWKRVESMIDVFGEENIKIVIFEELKNNTEEVFRDVLHFLGIKSDPELGDVDKNEAAKPLRGLGWLITLFHKAGIVGIIPAHIRKVVKKIILRPAENELDSGSRAKAWALFGTDSSSLAKKIPEIHSWWDLPSK